jgi:hypothetical protein
MFSSVSGHFNSQQRIAVPKVWEQFGKPKEGERPPLSTRELVKRLQTEKIVSCNKLQSLRNRFRINCAYEL